MSKVNIEIILIEQYVPFQTAMKVKVTDLESKTYIHFGAPPVTPRTSPIEPTSKDEGNSCFDGVITLYSDKDFKEFTTALYDKFSEVKCGPCNNCSDVADFTLNHFFPEKKKQIDIYYGVLKGLFCLASPATMCFRCIPSPLFMNTPGDVHKKARILSCTSGSSHLFTESRTTGSVQTQESTTYQRMFD